MKTVCSLTAKFEKSTLIRLLVMPFIFLVVFLSSFPPSPRIVCSAENAPPTADAGLNKTVSEGDQVTLNGTNSTDPDGDIASYLWTQTSGPTVTLSSATVSQPSFTAPDVGPDGASLTFQLTVTDNGGLQATDNCIVNVTLQVTLAWDPRTEPDLAGYRIYYGTSSRNYYVSIDVGDRTSCTLTGLEVGVTYYFTSTAYDVDGNESAYSNEVVAQILDYDVLHVWRVDAIYSEDTTTGDIWNFTTSPEAVPVDLVVSNLTVGSGMSYEVVAHGLQEGDLAYIDRTYTIANYPAHLAGATFIRTANNDKFSSGDGFMSFDVNQDVTVYVAHDNRVPDKPSWLLEFTDTGEELVTTDTSFSIFRKDFPGGTVTLGGNEAYSMYCVIIVGKGLPIPQPPSKATNPSPNNGATDKPVDTVLSWSNGGGAISYDIYFGTDSSPDSGEFNGNQTSTSFDPGLLDHGTTYFWRVNARNSESTTAGDIWSFTTSPEAVPADLVVSNLTVGSGMSYEVVAHGLQEGDLAYIDRTYTIADFPAHLAGATFIRTANNDKFSSGDGFMSFDVDQDVTVYVAHDNRVPDKPSWLLEFTDTGEELVTTDTSFSIFRKDFPGGIVTLGGNEAYSMYCVIIVEKM